jgi:hypothetical protein
VCARQPSGWYRQGNSRFAGNPGMTRTSEIKIIASGVVRAQYHAAPPQAA